MRRRSVLAALGAAASALAGCNVDDDGSAAVSETATAAPVPTDPPTPEAAPPADLSALGVADAAALGDRHWRTLSATPHGFTREATVRDDGAEIRRMRVTVRASANASVYHFTFDVRDTERYPSQPVESYVEVWDDGTTYQRFGRDESEYAVATGRSFDAPSVRTTERYRVQRLFEAFAEATVEASDAGFDVVAAGLRPEYDVTPDRFRLLERPRDGRLAATVADSPLYVSAYRLTTVADVVDHPVDVAEQVDYRRLDEAPSRPAWVAEADEVEDED